MGRSSNFSLFPAVLVLLPTNDTNSRFSHRSNPSQCPHPPAFASAPSHAKHKSPTSLDCYLCILGRMKTRRSMSKNRINWRELCLLFRSCCRKRHHSLGRGIVVLWGCVMGICPNLPDSLSFSLVPVSQVKK
jgi:hypothetical protein